MSRPAHIVRESYRLCVPCPLCSRCCGHVEANLEPESIAAVGELVMLIKSGALPPTRTEGGELGEWASGKFSIVIPLDCKWGC